MTCDWANWTKMNNPEPINNQVYRKSRQFLIHWRQIQAILLKILCPIWWWAQALVAGYYHPLFLIFCLYIYFQTYMFRSYILIIHKARNSETFKFVHHVSIHKRRSFRLCSCFVHTIAQFSRILRFSLIPLHFSYLPYVDGRSLVPNVITSTIGQENFEKLSP